MANYANLLATIAANIYTNNNNEVTAAMVKTAVDQMVASLGAGYQFKDVATPATNPGTPDQKVYYIASEPGTYTYFPDSNADPLEVLDGEVAILYGSGSVWSKDVTGIPMVSVSQNSLIIGGEYKGELAGQLHGHDEWIYVIVDSYDRILCGIKIDGTIEWSAGVPTPVRDYLEQKMGDFSAETYDEMVAFLDQIILQDKTLQELLDVKVDGSYQDYPEYLHVITDSDKKVLLGIKKDGTLVIGGATEILSEDSGSESALSVESIKTEQISIDETEIHYAANPEYIFVIVDAVGKILSGIKLDGTIVNFNQPEESDAELTEEVLEALSPNRDYVPNYGLPVASCNCMIRFKTKQSLFRQPITNVALFSIPGICDTFVNNKGRGVNYFMDQARLNVTMKYGDPESDTYIERVNQAIQQNIYGKDLFSIRIKYPVVTGVDVNGEATITEYMPENLQGAYLRKTDTRISIFDADDVELWGYNASSTDEWEPIIDAMIAATAPGGALEDFEVIKYGCEGNTFGEVIPAIYENKIYLSKETKEIDYHQRPINGWVSLSHPMPSGSGPDDLVHKWSMSDTPPVGEGRLEETFEYEGDTITDVFRTYWDSYPTIIRTSDLGYEHYVRFNYHVKDGMIQDMYFSFDGFGWYLNTPQAIPEIGLKLALNESLVDVTGISIEPYKEIFAPAICMLHKVITTNIPDGDKNNITYQRLFDILSYFRSKKFSNISLRDSISSIDGGRMIDRPTFCLTFDDYRRADTWQNDMVRTLLEDFDVKVSYSSLLTPEALYSQEPTDEIMSSEEYALATNSGWTIFPHGVGQYNPYLTYAQFKNAWLGIKEKWVEWYNEIPKLYGNHSNSMQSYQVMVMKHWGYTYLHGTAYDDDYNPLMEAGASFIHGTIYPRFHIRGESYNTWEECKERIDQLTSRTGYGISNF